MRDELLEVVEHHQQATRADRVDRGLQRILPAARRAGGAGEPARERARGVDLL
jgi:hypothetical protein